MNLLKLTAGLTLLGISTLSYALYVPCPDTMELKRHASEIRYAQPIAANSKWQAEGMFNGDEMIWHIVVPVKAASTQQAIELAKEKIRNVRIGNEVATPRQHDFLCQYQPGNILVFGSP